MTTSDLALKAGVHEERIIDLELSRARGFKKSDVESLSRALGATLQELFGASYLAFLCMENGPIREF